jgi:hypothetical protein
LRLTVLVDTLALAMSKSSFGSNMIPGWLKALGVSGERLSRLRLAQGVVGRTTLALVVSVVVVGGIAWRISDSSRTLVILILLALALGVIGLFVLYFVRVMRFADANPMAATLEGSEWVQLEQIRLAAKGLPEPPKTVPIADPHGHGRALPPAGDE